MKITVNLYCLGIDIVFVGLMLSDLFAITELGYFDEIVGVLFAALCVYYLCKNRRKLQKTTWHLLLCLFGIGCVGLLSNAVYMVQPSILIVLQGAFLFMKQYFYGLPLLISIGEHSSSGTYSFMLSLSKCMLLALTILALANLVFNLGMTGPNGEFAFYAQFGGTVSCWVILFLAICYSEQKGNRVLWFSMATVIILLTQSGLGMLGIGLIVMVYLFLEKQKRFHWYYLIPILLIAIAISWREISSYLLDPTAPRAELLIYAFVTANTYFPLGSGFSTYASSMAVTHYSQLYYQYGFNRQWGMSPDNALFLMDSYYPMIIGETGYLGLLIFGIMIFLYVRKVIFAIKNKQVQNSALYLYTFLLAAGLGFGTGSSWGCAVYMLIPIFMEQGNFVGRRRNLNVKD